MDLLPSFLAFLQPFSQHLSARTFANLRTLLAGWLFAARHNVTGALRAGHDAALSGAARSPLRRHHSVYHRVFSAARWSLDAVGLALLDLIVTLATAAGQTIFLVIDDTVYPKQGRVMFGVDSHYDAANTGRKRSNAGQSLKRRGHCWVMLGVVLELPLIAGHYVCLPFLFRLYMNTQGAKRHGTAYRPRPELAREMLALVCGR